MLFAAQNIDLIGQFEISILLIIQSTLFFFGKGKFSHCSPNKLIYRANQHPQIAVFTQHSNNMNLHQHNLIMSDTHRKHAPQKKKKK